MSRHVIVISEDAMVYEDMETLRLLPNFGGRWDKAARVNRVRSVYPTITYPCHATMMTGVYPDKHGVLRNEQLMLGKKNVPWQLMRDKVLAPSVFDAAKAAGLTTAAVFWPMTGNDKNIDYLVDEYWPQTKDEGDAECFRNSGSSEEVIEKVVEPNLHFVSGRHRVHPYCDDFIIGCACAIIRNFKPDLLMVHPANIDAYRHQTGVFTPMVTHGLHEADHWLGQVMKAVEDAGLTDDTDVFIVSDHGQMNVTRAIALNKELADRGFITVNEKGEVADYRAIAKSGGLSGMIYLKDPSNKKDYDDTWALLNALKEDGIYGIGQVFTREEIDKKEHLSGDFAFAFETDGYTTFSDDWLAPIVRPLDNADYRFGRATHGYLPEKGPQPTLFAFGPDLKPGAVIEDARLVDEAPTFAKALGIPFYPCDGKALGELFK